MRPICSRVQRSDFRRVASSWHTQGQRCWPQRDEDPEKEEKVLYWVLRTYQIDSCQVTLPTKFRTSGAGGLF